MPLVRSVTLLKVLGAVIRMVFYNCNVWLLRWQHFPLFDANLMLIPDQQCVQGEKAHKQYVRRHRHSGTTCSY